jgi:hypothetical protein
LFAAQQGRWRDYLWERHDENELLTLNPLGVTYIPPGRCIVNELSAEASEIYQTVFLRRISDTHPLLSRQPSY